MRIMRWTGLLVAVVALVAAASAQLRPTSYGIELSGREYVRGHVLVGFDPSTPIPAIQPGQRLFGGVVETTLPEINVALVTYPETADIFSLISMIEQYPGVKFAEPDHVYHAAFTPNDPSWSSQYGPQKIGCAAVWDLWTGDAGTVIAIVDTGINYNHADLTGKVIKGYDYANNDSDPLDDNGHGTHCAGIAAANTNNGVGIAGVAYNCKLMAVKVLDSGGSGSLTAVASGINYATSNGAKVVSLSLGSSGGDSTLQSAVNNAWNNGVVVCAAAGNNGSTSLFYPAAYTNCIAVGATDSSDNRASFSNYGSSWVDVAAPGVNIYSTYGSSYANLSGTSMACPHCAGEAGFLYSKVGARSNANAQIVRNAIENNCDNVGTWIAHGRINIYKAYLSLGAPPTETTYNATSVTVTIGTPVAGTVNGLWTIDTSYFNAMSGITATYSFPGVPIQSIYGLEYYAEYNVGTGAKVSGAVDFQASSFNSTSTNLRVLNWTNGRWDLILSGAIVGPTEVLQTASMPGMLTSYISSTGLVRVKVQTTSSVPHQINTNLLRLRLSGY
jgi:thermitase